MSAIRASTITMRSRDIKFNRRIGRKENQHYKTCDVLEIHFVWTHVAIARSVRMDRESSDRRSRHGEAAATNSVVRRRVKRSTCSLVTADPGARRIQAVVLSTSSAPPAPPGCARSHAKIRSPRMTRTHPTASYTRDVRRDRTVASHDLPVCEHRGDCVTRQEGRETVSAFCRSAIGQFLSVRCRQYGGARAHAQPLDLRGASAPARRAECRASSCAATGRGWRRRRPASQFPHTRSVRERSRASVMSVVCMVMLWRRCSRRSSAATCWRRPAALIFGCERTAYVLVLR